MKYEPLDLLVQQATDNHTAMLNREKTAADELNEAKSAVDANKVTLEDYRVSHTLFASLILERTKTN